MSKPMAIVRLARGEVGFFDPLTRIHLNISSPQAVITPGMNVKNIKRSVRSGRLLLISGSLEPEVIKKDAPAPTKKVEAVKKEEPKKETPKKKEEVTPAETKKEEPEKPAEEKKEEPVKEEPKKEAPPKKESSKKAEPQKEKDSEK